MLTHSQRLENWLGLERVLNVSRNFEKWYGPPVAIAGVPGNVRVMPGGDFIGEYTGSRQCSALERATEILREEKFRRYKRARYQRGAFSGLSELIAAATGGKSCRMVFNKAGTAPTAIGGCMDLWMVGNYPTAGAAGAAVPGGTSPTKATTGAMPFVNAVSNANTSHFVNAICEASVAANDLLLTDLLLRAALNMTSTSTQAVTGTFSRYQNTTSTAADYAGGNFMYPACTGTVLAAVAHNWLTCQYTPQTGTGTSSNPSIAGISACAKNQVDLAVNNWFMPLASGDVGVYALTQMQSSADVTSGTADACVAHPLAVFSCPIASLAMNIDGVTSAFNLVTIFDNACLNFMELPKAAASACTYTGLVLTVSE